jgi:hypothetical protein
METLTVENLENPADILVEFLDELAKIDATPDKIERNSASMTAPDGTIITY